MRLGRKANTPNYTHKNPDVDSPYELLAYAIYHQAKLDLFSKDDYKRLSAERFLEAEGFSPKVIRSILRNYEG